MFSLPFIKLVSSTLLVEKTRIVQEHLEVILWISFLASPILGFSNLPFFFILSTGQAKMTLVFAFVNEITQSCCWWMMSPFPVQFAKDMAGILTRFALTSSTAPWRLPVAARWQAVKRFHLSCLPRCSESNTPKKSSTPSFQHSLGVDGILCEFSIEAGVRTRFKSSCTLKTHTISRV